jgi:hypothetical protein
MGTDARHVTAFYRSRFLLLVVYRVIARAIVRQLTPKPTNHTMPYYGSNTTPTADPDHAAYPKRIADPSENTRLAATGFCRARPWLGGVEGNFRLVKCGFPPLYTRGAICCDVRVLSEHGVDYPSDNRRYLGRYSVII